MSRGLENQLFQLKFTAKQMGRLSTKCLKEEKTEKEKIKKCLEKDNHDGARIHAQNAIRAKTNAQNYLRLSSRVDAVASRLESAIKMQQVTKSMGSVVKGMDKVLGSMNVEAISKVMDSFERSFEDMDVRSEYVEQTMNSSTTAAMPEGEVDTLMQMVADEHGLKMADTFGAASVAKVAAPSAGTQQEAAGTPMPAGGGPLSGAAEDDLEERLRKLRGS
eukprot:Transcript_20962.p1 GENE.Transcript_20962~~Transcript_20962.p1  ORF type:complete len:219 (-),score=89.23 Transcript_20962:112-768(-)